LLSRLNHRLNRGHKEEVLKKEINLLDLYPKTARDYDKRAQEKTLEIIRIANSSEKIFSMEIVSVVMAVMGMTVAGSPL